MRVDVNGERSAIKGVIPPGLDVRNVERIRHGLDVVSGRIRRRAEDRGDPGVEHLADCKRKRTKTLMAPAMCTPFSQRIMSIVAYLFADFGLLKCFGCKKLS